MGAARRAAVEEGLDRPVGNGADQLAERDADSPQRRRRADAFGDVPGPHQQQPEDGCAVVLGRQERKRRCAVRDDHDPELVGRVRRVLAQPAQHVRRLLERPVDRAAEHERADRVQVVLEGGGDAEVAAASAQAPEQLGLAVRVDAQPFAVRGDEVDGAQVVDREPVPAHEVAEPAAEGEPADPDVADRPARGGEAVSLGGEVQLRPREAGGRAGDAAGGVDRHRLHERQVDHHAVVAHRVPDHGVAAAAD